MQEAVVFQIAALLALLGMGLAWRGVMTQYAGFYDLSLAWSHVLWGFVLGAVVAALEFQTLFIPYYDVVIRWCSSISRTKPLGLAVVRVDALSGCTPHPST